MNPQPRQGLIGVLTREAILDYLERPLPDKLYISPLLDIAQIGSSSVDLRLGLDFKVTQRSKLAVLDLAQVEQDIEAAIRRYQKTVRVGLTEQFVLHPGTSVLSSTLEYVRLPNDLIGQVVNRSSWSRLGVQVNPATIFPGFAGTITLALINQGHVPIILRPGFRIAQLILHKLSGEAFDISRYMYATEAAFSLIQQDSDLQLWGPNVEPFILGIVSTIGAGRTTVINHLLSRGFKLLSLSEFVREEARDRGIDQVRNRLQDVGNSMRETHGNSILARRMMSRLPNIVSQGQYVVLDGIKHPDEVRELHKKRHFFLIAIDASPQLRFERILARRRQSDPKTWEDFQRLDERDHGIGEPAHGQQVASAMELADFRIENTGTIRELCDEIDRVLWKLSEEGMI